MKLHIENILSRHGFLALGTEKNITYFSKNGFLGSTYIFAIINTTKANWETDYSLAYSWIVNNVKPKSSLAQIGFNAIFITELPIEKRDLSKLVDMHAIKDLSKLSPSLISLLENTKDIISQTAINFYKADLKPICVSTWILLGSVKKVFSELSA